MIHTARIESNSTVADVAERAGISRGLVHRIEKGEMGSSIGAAFEVAAVVGLHLFESEPTALTCHLSAERGKLTLLPQSARTGTTTVKDDF
ncbi:MAG: helix-turn-helix transcriptional regulator [Rhodobacteraceae bacterium]|nr:helix-turn-helix transcriptional regulator [Paracoccaceae bacterium]